MNQNKPDIILPSDTTGIVLAGGKSSRLGDDKALITLNGRSLLLCAIEVLSPFCSRVLISSSMTGLSRYGHPVIPDEQPDCGPMMGLYSCIRASGTRHHLVIAVDNVLVGPEFYSWLARRYDGSAAALPFLDNRHFEPLTGYYGSTVLAGMHAMISAGNYKLPDLLNIIPVQKLDVQRDFPHYHDDYFKSINTPEDLSRLAVRRQVSGDAFPGNGFSTTSA